MANTKEYIPALKYNWLTRIYDPILQITMPEKEIKLSLLKHADLKPCQNILDFGCGTLTLTLMGKHHYPQTNFFGVDVDAKVLAIAREKIKTAQVEIDIKEYDGEVLPYVSETFDHVISSLVFHHLTYDQKLQALLEIRRILKPGGQLHIADFGSPVNYFQRVGFYTIQLLDGFKTTSDSVNALLPILIRKAGFSEILETNIFKTIFGTIRLVKSTNNPGMDHSVNSSLLK